MLCADVVQARWKDREGKRRHTTALLEDISRHGACLQLEKPVPLGIVMEMHCHRRELVGTVRYCVFREIGYFVGVEFEDQSEWTEREFKPRHLLDLRKLMKTNMATDGHR